MKDIFQHRGLRLIFIANLISMIGSGMNTAGVTWYILQKTHSETALGTMTVMLTIPALLMLPFTGVIIDREDRRIIIMLLDGLRAVIILAVAILALRGREQAWMVYSMVMLVAAGFYMFWPTITALIQELTPQSQFIRSNTFLLAGVQGGWLIAGSIVGFVYNHIGLGGVLLIDVLTYVASFSCYMMVRKGKHTVKPATPDDTLGLEIREAETALERFIKELREGLEYIFANRYVLALGTSWFLFLGAMTSQSVLTAPLSDRVFHSGAVGYGWLNAGWGVGAFLSVTYSAWFIRQMSSRYAITIAMALMAVALFSAPLAGAVGIGVVIYGLAGSARGVGGVAISSTIMEIVPRHFMGRVQNTFFFAGLLLQMGLGYAVGVVAHNVSLFAAFAIIAAVYTVASLAALVPVRLPASQPSQEESIAK
jgi:MFS family permease